LAENPIINMSTKSIKNDKNTYMSLDQLATTTTIGVSRMCTATLAPASPDHAKFVVEGIAAVDKQEFVVLKGHKKPAH
jgi:hypothetical protein